MADELLEWRREFPILEQAVYLISHSLGAMPRGTYERLQEYAEMWATRGVRAWAEGWWDMPLTVGDEVARIIGAAARHRRHAPERLRLPVAHPLLLRPDAAKRNKIVYSELEFPSVMYVYEAHARDGRFRIETVKSDDGMTVPLERMLAAIDEETLLVPHLARPLQERVPAGRARHHRARARSRRARRARHVSIGGHGALQRHGIGR